MNPNDIDKIAELYPKSYWTHAWVAFAAFATYGIFYLYWAARTSSRLRRSVGLPRRVWGVKKRLVVAGVPLVVVAAATGLTGLAWGESAEATIEMVGAALVPVWYVVSVANLGNFGYRLAQDIRLVRVAAGEPSYRVSARRWTFTVALFFPMMFVPLFQILQLRRLVHTHGTGRLQRGADSGPEQFEYWYAEVTHLDEPSSKERPVLVLTRNLTDAWVLKVSSQDKTHRPEWRRIDNTGWDRPGEGKESWLELDAIHTVPIHRFRRYLGTETDAGLVAELTERHPNHLEQGERVG